MWNIPRGIVVFNAIHYYSHSVIYVIVLINHLLFMDDMKPCGKTERELQSYSSYSLGNIERYWHGTRNGQIQYCGYKERQKYGVY